MLGGDWHRWRGLGCSVLLLAGCHSTPSANTPCPAAAATPDAARAATPGAPKAPPGLSIEIEPRPDPPARVLVTLAGTSSQRFVLASAAPAELRDVRATDETGDVPVAIRQAAASVRLELARPPKGRVTLHYTRNAATPGAEASSELVTVDATRALLAGEKLLALPEGDAPVPVELHIVTAAYHGPFERAASSFGVGDRIRVDASSAALSHATFVVGQMGHALLDGPEGWDSGAWLGYTAFDPRSSVAELAGFRSAARQYFGERDVLPFTLLLVTDQRPAGDFDVSRRTTSVLARVGVNQTYNGPLRVAVGQQALREWLGATLFVGDPREPGRSRWFTQGFTRYLARELCFRFGLMSPAEYAAEAEELERIALTSPLAKESDDELAKSSDGLALALQTARGARHAADLDARLRAKSGGKRSLDHVLHELYAKAKAARAPLPESEWRAMLQTELGPDAVKRFEAGVKRGQVTPLPRDALGVCFAPVARRYSLFSLGFELEGELVRGVTPGSPAARAGLRAGDRVIASRYRAGDASVRAVVEGERDGKPEKLEFLPAGGSVAGQGFHRLPTPKDEDCPRR
jgi:PDZ domain